MSPKFDNRIIPGSLIVIFVFLFVAALVGSNWLLIQHLPQESSFLRYWQITRDFIFNGQNPYLSSTHLYVEPLPILLLYTPFALISDFNLARAFWMAGVEIALVLGTFLSFRITHWEVPKWLAGVFFIFSIFWFPAFSLVLDGSPVIWLFLFFIALILVAEGENDEIAGILLAVVLLQPQVFMLISIPILVWVISHRRLTFIFWLVAAFAVLTGFGMLFIISWPLDFFRAALNHLDYTFADTLLQALSHWWPGIGAQLGWVVAVLASILIVVEWVLLRHRNTKHLIWTVAVSSAITVWIGATSALPHIIVLFLAVIVIARAWDRRWGRSSHPLIVVVLLFVFTSLWGLIIYGYPIEQVGYLIFIFFPFFCLVGLYWVRWWFLRPEYLD